jgi:hypothetical protein
MAQGKKSFVLYCDLIHTIDKMPNDKAGELFKHILHYVNDLNPTTNDLVIDLTFEPIKQQLKRDLDKWENRIKPLRQNAGRLGGLAKASKRVANVANDKQNLANLAVNVNDNVNLNDNKLAKASKPRKIRFEDSELFDKFKFKDNFPEWSKEKLIHYYDAALRYSIEGNKYVSWKLAIQTWERKDTANKVVIDKPKEKVIIW